VALREKLRLMSAAVTVAVLTAVAAVAMTFAVGAEAFASLKGAGQARVQYLVHTAGYPDYLVDIHLLKQHLSPLAHSTGNNYVHVVVTKQARDAPRLMAGVFKFASLLDTSVN